MSESWDAVLDRGAAKLAASIVSDIERVVRSTDPIDIEIVSLALVYVQDSESLVGEVSLNPSRDVDDFASGRGGWWPIDEIEYDVEPALEAQLLRDAALHSIEDPVRTVLNATAALLARHTWSALFPVSDDFVAFIAEHDEGIQEKVESLRACNPSERAEPWVALLLETESF
jgi:hypothetical protein